METIKKVTIEANADALQFGYWDMEDESFVPIAGMSEAELKQAAIDLGCSELLLDALVMLTEHISQAIGGDLKDIWQRLETST